MTLREEIRQAMKQQRVSAYYLARVTGISRSALSRFLNGKTSLPSHRVDLLREQLGLD